MAYNSSALASDPAYLAFLRTSGLVQAQAAQEVQRRSAALKTALDLRMPQMDQDNAVAQRNLAGNYEARGMLKSGSYLRDNSELLRTQGRARTGLIMDTQNEMAGYASNLAQSIAEQQRAAAEAALKTADKITIRDAGY